MQPLFSGQDEKKHLLTAFLNLPVEEEASIKGKKKKTVHILPQREQTRQNVFRTKHQSNADNELEFIETCQLNKNIYLLLNSTRSS